MTVATADGIGGACSRAKEGRCRGAEKGLSNFEEQDASWGEGERDYGEEERGGGGEGYWEGGREVGRSRTGV
jgi:hypothetical protein